MPVQVFAEVARRNGELKRLEVIRIEENLDAALADIPAGQYKVIDGTAVKTVNVSYRTVQDVVTA